MKVIAGLKMLVVTLLLICGAMVAAHAQNADDILGIYYTPKKDGKIELFKVGNEYFGKFIWGEAGRKDTKNPAPALRTRALLGVVFLSNFTNNSTESNHSLISSSLTSKTVSLRSCS